MGKIKNLLKQDNGWIAAVLGIALPFIMYYPLYYLVNWISLQTNMGVLLVQENTIQLVAIFLNFLFLKKYISGKEYEKNGKVSLAVTFFLVILHFAITWS